MAQGSEGQTLKDAALVRDVDSWGDELLAQTTSSLAESFDLEPDQPRLSETERSELRALYDSLPRR